MIVQGVTVLFGLGQIGIESYSYDGAMGVANGWVANLDETTDPEVVGKVLLEGLANSDQDFTAPSSMRDGQESRLASALGFRGFDDMLRSAPQAVNVLRRGDRIKIHALTTDRLSFGATKDNWKTHIDATSDAATVGAAVLEARGHCRL